MNKELADALISVGYAVSIMLLGIFFRTCGAFFPLFGATIFVFAFFVMLLNLDRAEKAYKKLYPSPVEKPTK